MEDMFEQEQDQDEEEDEDLLEQLQDQDEDLLLEGIDDEEDMVEVLLAAAAMTLHKATATTQQPNVLARLFHSSLVDLQLVSMGAVV